MSEIRNRWLLVLFAVPVLGWGQTLPPLSALPDAPVLKYRSANNPLSIAEMSDMHLQKNNADFLRQHGYTSRVVKRRSNTGTGKAKPREKIRVLALWGQPQQLQAEILLEKKLYTVQGGEKLSQHWQVLEVTNNGVTVQYHKGRSRKQNTLVPGKEWVL